MKACFCLVSLLILAWGQVVNKVLSHLGFIKNVHISVTPSHIYSKCEKYDRFYIKALLTKLTLLPSLRTPWAVHSVTNWETSQNFVTELRARDMQGRVRWQALALLVSPRGFSLLWSIFRVHVLWLSGYFWASWTLLAGPFLIISTLLWWKESQHDFFSLGC